MTTIRPFKASDLEACYSISLATGFEGGDASHLYRDPKLMGHIYVGPYALLEPALALVAEDGDGVAGFAVGTADTTAWEDRLEREWWPSLRRQFADPIDVPAADRTADQRRAFMIHHPENTPPAVAGSYAAHLHMNLLPRLQRRGIGSKLLDSWLERVASVGARTMHVGVNRANGGAILFWASRGFHELAVADQAQGRTLWMGRSLALGSMTGQSFSASIHTN